MVSSFRDNLYRSPNFAIMGTEIPERLRRVRPPYADNPPIVPPPDPNNPFGDPPRFHEVDPPEQNPYNDPDYSPFIVTENPSQQIRGEHAGGLLGRLLAMMQQDPVLPNAATVLSPNSAPEYNPDNYSGPEGRLLGTPFAQQDEQAPNTVYSYGTSNPDRGTMVRAYAAPRPEISTAPQKAVRILSRRVYR